MRTGTKRLQIGKDPVFIVMDYNQALHDKKIDVVTEAAALKKQQIEFEAKQYHSRKYAAAVEVCVNAVKNELPTAKGALPVSCVECANLWMERNGMNLQMLQSEGQSEQDIYEGFDSFDCCVCPDMHGCAKEAGGWVSMNLTELELKAKRAMADVRVTLNSDRGDVYLDVAQCEAILKNRLKKLGKWAS